MLNPLVMAMVNDHLQRFSHKSGAPPAPSPSHGPQVSADGHKFLVVNYSDVTQGAVLIPEPPP